MSILYRIIYEPEGQAKTSFVLGARSDYEALKDYIGSVESEKDGAYLVIESPGEMPRGVTVRPGNGQSFKVTNGEIARIAHKTPGGGQDKCQ